MATVVQLLHQIMTTADKKASEYEYKLVRPH